jgi:hypothetical protein
MEYFYDGNWKPSGDGFCADTECPCRGSSIPRGQGFLYVNPEVANFRRDFKTQQSAIEEMELRVIQKFGRPVSYRFKIGPELLCKQAARKRRLDLDIAVRDARFWWETGKAPARETPLATSRAAEDERRTWQASI